MPLSPEQITQIRQSAAESSGPEARVWLFGSRVGDSKLGGDVDLLIQPDPMLAYETLPRKIRFLGNLEIVGAPQRVTGKAIPAQTQQRHLGDSAVFASDGQKARQALGWPPRFEDLGTIVDQRQLPPAATRGPTPA